MIYIVTLEAQGVAKIGCSENPIRRLGNLQTASATPLVLAVVAEGGQDEERRLHQRFASDRMLGEWFTLGPELEWTILALRASAVSARQFLDATDPVVPSGWERRYGEASAVADGRQIAEIVEGLC